MITQLSNLNWLGVLLAFVPYTFLGGLWFPILFVKPYKASLGKAGEELKFKDPIFFVGPMICTLVVTITTAVLIYALNIDTLGETVELSMLIGFGFLVANTFNIAINPNIPHPIQYGIITGAYHLVGISIASVIIYLMR